MLFALTGVNILWSSTCNSGFFLSVMFPKDLALFLYIPTKNPLFNDKVWTYYRILVSKWVKSQKTEKTGPTHKPRYRQKFHLLLRYNLFIGANEMRVKILPLLCRLGLDIWNNKVLTVGSIISVELRHHAKFRGDWSNRCHDISFSDFSRCWQPQARILKCFTF